MKVSEAVLSRCSIRAFTSEPLDNEIIKDLLNLAARSPSGGNLQPWKIFVVNDHSMKQFIEFQAKMGSTRGPWL